MSDELVYRLDGQMTEMVPVGATADGVRMNGHFSGVLYGGPLNLSTVTLVDYFRLRADGVGVVDAQEIIHRDGSTVAAKVDGYVLPPPELEIPPPEVIMSEDFAWPDVPLRIEAFATFQTGDPDLADLNRLIVGHTGSVNLATGDLIVEARRLG